MFMYAQYRLDTDAHAAYSDQYSETFYIKPELIIKVYRP